MSRPEWSTLRPYQVAALEAVAARKVQRGVIAHATGCGKGHLAGHLTEAIGSKRVLYIAHREELIDQLNRHVRRVVGPLGVGVEMAGQNAGPMAQTVIASWPSLVARGCRRLDALGRDRFDAVVVDEAHRYLASTAIDMLDRLGFVYWGKDEQGHRALLKTDSPSAFLCGLTATPHRGDGIGLWQVFDEVLHQYELKDAIKDGWLVPIRAFTVRTGVRLDGIKTVGGEYNEGDLDKRVNTPERIETVITGWERYAKGLRTLGFGVTISHAENMAAAFVERGYDARAISGRATSTERSEVLKWFRRTPGAILINCSLYLEGLDVPGVECVLMAKPTRSKVNFAQMMGRGTRLADGARDYADSVRLGKSHMVLVDVTDASETIGKKAITIMGLLGAPLPDVSLEGEDVLEVLARQEEEVAKPRRDSRAKRTGEIDLFAPLEGEDEVGNLRWLKYEDAGACLYLPDRTMIRVVSNALGAWRAERREPDSSAWSEVLAGGEREQIIKAVEDGVTGADPAVVKVLGRNQAWRRSGMAPTAKQLGIAKSLGIDLVDEPDRGMLSDRITKALAARSAKDSEPASSGQRWKLRQLGVEFGPTLTNGEARRLIVAALREAKAS